MISFVIPTYTEGKALQHTLRSIRTLTLQPLEIIVSDGGSMDETLPIARELADRVLEWRESRRQTIGEARNLGAKAAEGEWLVFMDADVRIEHMDQFFARALGHFAKDSRLGLLLVQFRLYPEEERFIDWLMFGMSNLNLAFQNNVLRLGAAQGDFMMLRREAFLNVGGFDPALVATEDMDLAVRVAKRWRTHFDLSLKIGQSSRRVRALGWLKLIWLWNSNYVYYLWRGSVRSKEWQAIR